MAADKVNSNPILVESSTEIFSVDAAEKKTYSLIPIPPNEKTERMDDNTNTKRIPMIFEFNPNENNMNDIDKNWKKWTIIENKKVLRYPMLLLKISFTRLRPKK